MIKTILLILVCAITVLLTAISSDDILGYWVTEDASSVVEIKSVNGLYEASIVALKEPLYIDAKEGIPGTIKMDKFNPQENLRSNPVLGLKIMKDFLFKKDTWKSGTIYDPKNGKTYKCKMSYNDKGNLDVRGYIGVPALGRTTEWMRPDTYVKTNSLESLGYEYPSPELKQ